MRGLPRAAVRTGGAAVRPVPARPGAAPRRPERWWFRIQFAGEDVPLLYYSDDDPGQDFDRLDGDAGAAFAVWRAECERSRQITAGAGSLEETGTRKRTGGPISLRRIVVDMIAEYARHNGHADFLREHIDGATGM